MNTEGMIKKKIYGRPKVLKPLPLHWCPGCHEGIAVGLVLDVLEELGLTGQCIGVSSVGCSGSIPMFANIDFVAAGHGRANATATGAKRARPDAVVFTIQGDGDLGAIGLGHFMNALHRGERLTNIFVNNANYGQTGGQMAPTTLLGMQTTTTPYKRDADLAGFPLHAAELAASMKGVAYSARWTVHTPANYQRAKRSIEIAFQKQMEGIGYSLVEILCGCPTNWGFLLLKHCGLSRRR